MDRQTAFICYDHVEDTQSARELELLCRRAGVSLSDTPEDAGVTIVLIGPKAWSRAAVDEEIRLSLSNGRQDPNGVIGVLLEYHGSLPKRLADNVSSPLELQPCQTQDDGSYCLMTTWDRLLPPRSWQYGSATQDQIEGKARQLRELIGKARSISVGGRMPLNESSSPEADQACSYPRRWWL